jgi:hypothetical protein
MEKTYTHYVFLGAPFHEVMDVQETDNPRFKKYRINPESEYDHETYSDHIYKRDLSGLLELRRKMITEKSCLDTFIKSIEEEIAELADNVIDSKPVPEKIFQDIFKDFGLTK